jgi:hypothetical protein
VVERGDDYLRITEIQRRDVESSTHTAERGDGGVFYGEDYKTLDSSILGMNFFNMKIFLFFR